MERVLGLNGVYPRSHDISACLVEETGIDSARIVANVEEERFTRVKRAFEQPPHNAINFCLDAAGVEVNELTAITWGWKAEPLSARQVLPPLQASRLDREVLAVAVEHHEAHAASVFYTSPFERAAVIVVDGQGEHESTTLWSASKTEGMKKVKSEGIERSLGYLYGAVSRFCGLGSFGAGKVMGLAPYGTPRYVGTIREIFDNLELPTQTGIDSQDAFFNEFLTQFADRGFEAAQIEYTLDPVTQSYREQPVLQDVHRDMAASVQQLLEGQMLDLAQEAKELTGADYLCLAGGVAMNCVTNSILQDSGIYKDVFIQPGCEDSGVAMGSALAYLKRTTDFESPYTGPSYTDSELAAILNTYGIEYTSHENISEVAARIIANNGIIGWFQGGLEFGPRALGARSILANPGSAAMRDRVNAVKQREVWRPFGPSVLAEYTTDLFDNPHSSPYMLRSFQVADRWKERMAGIVHVDGSTRPQTVSPESNPRYYALLRAFHKLTGLPGVINTSFNNFNEPIVASPADAIRTYNTTGLDALVLGNHLIQKRRR